MKAFIPVNVAISGKLCNRGKLCNIAKRATAPYLNKKNSVRLFEVSTRQAPANSRNYSQDVNSYLPPSRSGLVVECLLQKKCHSSKVGSNLHLGVVYRLFQ